MRTSAQVLLVVAVFLFSSLAFHTKVYAQTAQPSPITAQSSNTINNFLTPDTDANVPENHHTYTQVVLIDMLSAVSCVLTGTDPTNATTPCLGVNPTTGKIGLSQTTQPQQFGQLPNQSQPQGIVGVMGQYISYLYVPTVSSSQYVNYLASNFGIVKKADAAAPSSAANCTTTFGYGFCGLSPIFTLWTGMRDFAYMLLTVLFIAIGIGVMLRFKVDPRTVMTLQNQIPRVVISIILITFSYAISGFMVDLMWTTTYAGINFISSSSPNSQICIDRQHQPQPIAQVIDQQLIDNPLSFLNTLFKGPNIANGADNCGTEGIDSGVLSLASNISASFGDLVNQILSDLFSLNNSGCGFSINPFSDLACITKSAFGTAILWITEQIIKLIIIVAILICMFRLWFQLIKCYVTFLIFVVLGPLWIVFGLIPGRPLGFEKWLRIIFANLAVFPVVAFLLVFARVLVDTGVHPGVLGAATTASDNPHVLAAATVNGQSAPAFPFIANTNIPNYLSFAALGILLILPNITDIIKNSLKATSQGKYGATVAAGLGFAAGAATSPGKKVWDNLNRRNHTTGAAEGALAIQKQRVMQRLPIVGRRAMTNRRIGHLMEQGYDYRGAKEEKQNEDTRVQERVQQRRQAQTPTGAPERPSLIRRITGRGQKPETGGASPRASAATTAPTFNIPGPLNGKRIPVVGDTSPLPTATTLSDQDRRGFFRKAGSAVVGKLRPQPSGQGLRSDEEMESIFGSGTPKEGRVPLLREGAEREEKRPSQPKFRWWQPHKRKNASPKKEPKDGKKS